MTSKEALKQLYEFALSSEPMEITIKDFKDIILKDLKVLEAHKKIEEELGIDLITLFEALKNGIFTYKEYIPAEDLVIWKGQLYHKPMMSAFNIDLFMFDDYGTKWGLTKEELLNDK